ncbi:MAG: NAD(P)H-hydrate epimerase [Dehalococcoidia bacterium]|nr:NAD(P)H-hydrate epimerase [Dehalococcoidia bacterium]
MKVLTTAQMHQLEENSVKSGVTMEMLMENAGQAVADEAGRILEDIRQQQILILIGPGNNGGDGLVAARHLHDAGAKVFLYLFGQRPSRDPTLKPIRERRIKRIEAEKDDNLDELTKLLASVDTVIDALFGTGTTRPFSGLLLMVLDRVRRAKIKRPDVKTIALDIPSGLNADTGEAGEGRGNQRG